MYLNIQYSDLRKILCFQFPVKVVKQTSHGITQTLNEIGERIIGLE